MRRVDPRSSLLLAGAILAFAAFSTAFDVRPPVFLLVAAVAISVINVRRASLLLRVDTAGVRLGRGFAPGAGRSVVRSVTVPWASLGSVRLVRSVEAAEAIDLRLRPDAPLPDGVRGIIRAPGQSEVSAPELRLSLPPGKLDHEALRRAVTAFGGGAVAVHDAA